MKGKHIAAGCLLVVSILAIGYMVYNASTDSIPFGIKFDSPAKRFKM